MQVEIWADVVCPWCFIGKRRFDQALDRFEGRDDVQVVYRAFQLDPSAPAERPGHTAEHIARKYGTTVEEAKARQAQIAALGAADGIEFRFDAVRGASSFDAHRLIRSALDHGVQEEMVDRLLRAHFTEGELISDPAVLARLAGELGVPAPEPGEHAESVRADQELAASFGVRGVPFFAVDRSIGATGAQDVEVLLDMLQESVRRSAARPRA